MLLARKAAMMRKIGFAQGETDEESEESEEAKKAKKAQKMDLGAIFDALLKGAGKMVRAELR